MKRNRQFALYNENLGRWLLRTQFFSLYVEAQRAKQSASTTRGSKYGVVNRLDRLLA